MTELLPPERGLHHSGTAAAAFPSRRQLRQRKAAFAGLRLSQERKDAPKRNPFAVLGAMVIVGGMFAAVGLPAYGLSQTTDADVTAAARVATQSLAVSANAATGGAPRDGYQATSPERLARASMDSIRSANNQAYLASGARELGDDYPWAYELAVSQGGGLSPLNYYYRQCTDFVAWRLNRDVGSYSEPFTYVWANLTPAGGDGRQWRANWVRNGWTVSDVPIVGSVAWWSSQNHVAYVKTVNPDGTVVVEEYNYIPNVYSQRTIPASEVEAFLYPPGQ